MKQTEELKEDGQRKQRQEKKDRKEEDSKNEDKKQDEKQDKKMLCTANPGHVCLTGCAQTYNAQRRLSRAMNQAIIGPYFKSYYIESKK